MAGTPHSIILVGHGGVPSDFPRNELIELKRLEGARRATGEPLGLREAELDAKIRNWPRTDKTDPYLSGIEALRNALEQKTGTQVVAAYNEFCTPSIEQAIAKLAAEGAKHLVVVPTMLTPGGSHSEVEIPEIIADCRRSFPSVRIEYAWPFDVDALASLFDQHLKGWPG